MEDNRTMSVPKLGKKVSEGFLEKESELPAALEWKPSTHELLIMLTLSIVSFMVALDACIVVTSIGAIVADLGGDTTQALWIGTSYLLANAVFMPSIASLSGIFGRPISLWVSLVFFTVGCIICSTAGSLTVLLAGRCIQGIGGGGITVLSNVVFSDFVPLRFRPKWYGTVQGAWALGTCLGPIIGGAIADNTTWRWIFYIMFPFCAIGLFAVPYLLTIKPRTATLGEKLRRVDWTGGVLFTSSTTILLAAISWGGSQYAWNSVQTLAPLIIGFVVMILTFVYEQTIAKEPFLPRSIFNNYSAIAAYACAAVQGLVLYGDLYYIPFYFLSVKQAAPINAGVNFLTLSLTVVPCSIVTGALVTRFHNYRYPIWIGWILLAGGSAMTAFLLHANTSTGVWVVSFIIVGFGHGAILNALNFATQASADSGQEGTAAAMYSFFRQFGMVFGVGVGSSVFQNVMALKLSWQGLSTDIAKNSEAFVAELDQLPDGDAFKAQVLDSYVFGFKGVFLMYLVISCLAFLVSLLIKHYDMNKDVATEHQVHESVLSRRIDTLATTSGIPATYERGTRHPVDCEGA